MNQKILKFLSSFLILLFSSNTLADNSFLPGIKKIINKGELVVSFTPQTTTLFTEVDKNQNITGIDVEIAELIAKELGVKLTITTTAPDWNGVISEVSNGRADLGISFLSITTTRSKSVLYTRPYVQIRQVLLFNNLSVAMQRKNGASLIKEMFTNKNGMTVGVFAGSSYVDFANHLFPGGKIKEYDTIEELVDSTLKRNIDAILVDESEVFHVLRKNPGIKVKVTEVALQDAPDLISIAVDPTNRDLLDFVNNVLQVRQINYTVHSAYSHTLEKQKEREANSTK